MFLQMLLLACFQQHPLNLSTPHTTQANLYKTTKHFGDEILKSYTLVLYHSAQAQLRSWNLASLWKLSQKVTGTLQLFSIEEIMLSPGARARGLGFRSHGALTCLQLGIRS
jgi:hypothetical protein